MTQRPYHQQHPAMQLLYFIVVMVVAILIGSAIGAGIIAAIYGVNTLIDIFQANINSPTTVRALWILQIVSTTIPIGIIPIFFSYIVVKEPREYLRLNTHFPWFLLVLVFFIMLLSQPLMELLINFNQKLSLPPSLKGLEEWMRNSEKQAEQMTAILLKMNSIFDLIKTLLLVAALTALVEELMFRGALQTIFLRWTKNYHAAIWITAALFSAFHMEFFGFLPRMLLGIFFGYFVYWSGSIWPAVLGHFLNNGTAVVVTYLYQNQVIHVNPEDQHIFNYFAYVFSAIITVILLINYKAYAHRKMQLQQH